MAKGPSRAEIENKMKYGGVSSFKPMAPAAVKNPVPNAAPGSPFMPKTPTNPFLDFMGAKDLSGGKEMSALDPLKYGAEKTASGFLSPIEGAGRFIGSSLYNASAGIADLVGADDLAKDYKSIAEGLASKSYTQDWSDSADERYKPNATQNFIGTTQNMVTSVLTPMGVGGAATKVGTKAAPILNPALQKSITKAGGNIGLGAMGVGAAGNSMIGGYETIEEQSKAREAMTGIKSDTSGNLAKAQLYGAAVGGVEGLTERIFGFVPMLGGGVLDDTIKKSIGKVLAKPSIASGVNAAAGIIGEGFEEVLAGAADPFLQRITVDPTAPLATKQELAQQFTMGVIASAILRGGMGGDFAGRQNERAEINQVAGALNGVMETLPTQFRLDPLQVTSRTTRDDVIAYGQRVQEAQQKVIDFTLQKQAAEVPILDEEIDLNPMLNAAQEKYDLALGEVEKQLGTRKLTAAQKDQVKAELGIDIRALEKEVKSAIKDGDLPAKARLEKAIAAGVAEQYYPESVLNRYYAQKQKAEEKTNPTVTFQDKAVTKSELKQVMLERYPDMPDAEFEKFFAKVQMEDRQNPVVEDFVRQANTTFAQYGVKIEAAYDLPDGTNGAYESDGKGNYTIFINARDIKSHGVASYVLSHEITHYAIAKDPQLLRELKVAMKALNYNVEEMNEARRDNYKAHTENMDEAETEAYLSEESIADFVSMIMRDDSVLIQLAQKRPSTLRRILNYISERLNYGKEDRLQRKMKREAIKRIQAALDGKPLPKSKSPWANQKQDGPRLKDRKYSISSFFEGLGLTTEEALEGGFRVLDNAAEVGSITREQVINSPMGALITTARDNRNISGEEYARQIKGLTEYANMLIAGRDSGLIYAFTGAHVFSAMKNNSDSQYGKTIDFSSICKKTQQLINSMSQLMVEKKAGLTTKEIAALYDAANSEGEPVPCPMCYVFSRWVGIGGLLQNQYSYQNRYENYTRPQLEAVIAKLEKKVADYAKANKKTAGAARAEMVQKQQKVVDKLVNRAAEGENVARELAKESDKLEELRSLSWLKKVRMKDGYKSVPPEVLFDLNRGAEFANYYPDAWAWRTAQGAGYGKAITPYEDARIGEIIQGLTQDSGDILIGESNPFSKVENGAFNDPALAFIKKGINKLQAQNLIGGQRMQSYSDFRYEYGLDYMMAFYELQAVGAKAQTYTKVIEAVDGLASVGVAVNLSVMPEGVGYRVKEGGGYELTFSTKTGMHIDAAVDAMNRYDNAGPILVGINDTHIAIALADDRIPFIIPYHQSGGNNELISQMLASLDEAITVAYTDYTPVQEDKINPQASPAQKAAYDLRMRIVMKEADTLSAEDKAILDNNKYLADLHSRFYTNENAEEYGAALTKDQAKSIMPYEYWDKTVDYANSKVNGQRFLEYCESLGVVPRFSGRKVEGGKVVDHVKKGQKATKTRPGTPDIKIGDFSKEDFYWKLLVDRRMYGRDGKYLPQAKVTLSNFKTDYINPQYGVENYLPWMTKDTDPEKTQRIVDKAKTRYSLQKDSTGTQLTEAQAEFFKDSKVRDADGNLLKMYHGTTRKFTVFKEGNAPGWGRGIYLTDNRETALDYGESVMEVYADLRNPYMSDPQGIIDISKTEAYQKHSRKIAEREADDLGWTVEEYLEEYPDPVDRYELWEENFDVVNEALREMGYDGIIATNSNDVHGLEVVVFGENKVKSVDNLNPTTDPDIRYSLQKDSTGTQLTEAQAEFFKDSKVRDADGNLLKVYHGTNGEGFTRFEFSRNGGFFFTHKREVAEEFTGEDKTGDIIEVYLNITNPLEIDADGQSSSEVQAFFNVGTDDEYMEIMDADAWVHYAKRMGYDGVLFKNIDEGTEEGILSTVAVALEPNQIKSVDNLNPTTDPDIRYSLQRDLTGKMTAAYTDSKIKELFDRYSVEEDSSHLDYAQRYVTYISPEDFLSLTATDGNIERIKKAAVDKYGRLDLDELQGDTSGPFLEFDIESGEVVGHEGRHRMALMQNEGVEKVAIMLRPYPNERGKYDRKKIMGLKLTGEEFSTGKASGEVTIDEAIPLSNRHRQEVYEKFGGNTGADIRYSIQSDNLGQQLTPGQQEYFAGTKAVDDSGQLVRVYHGTMSDFWEFSKAYGNPEGDMGAGFYFTNNEEDVWSNYATEDGADITSKIEKYAETLMNDGDLEWDDALEEARQQFVKREEPRLIEAYLKIENPIVLDGRNSTTFDYIEDYDPETEEYGEPSGLFVEFVESIKNVLEDYEGGADYMDQINGMYERFSDDGNISAYDAIKDAKDILGDFMDYDTGAMGGNEVIRQALEDLGFDGIIDKMVAWKFGDRSGRKFPMEGVTPDTTHYIVFDSNQAKEIDNENPTSVKDIRYSIGKSMDAYLAEWEAAQQTYGTKAPGMSPRVEARANQVPEQIEDGTRVSDFMRSVHESPNTPDEMIKPLELKILSGTGSYAVLTDKTAQAKANELITRHGLKWATEYWHGLVRGTKAVTKSDLALGEILLVEAADRGDVAEWEKLVTELSAEATRAGQVLQAFSMMKKLSPQGRAYSIKLFVDKLNTELVERYGKKAPDIKIDAELRNRLDAATTIDEMDAIEDLIIRNVAEQMPATLGSRVTSWRYLAMLGNFRTHNRNIISNMAMMIVREAKDLQAGAIEGVLSKTFAKDLKRTKTIVPASKEIRDFAWQDWANVKDILLGSSKYGHEDRLQRYRSNFGKKGLWKAADAADKLNSGALQGEDNFFMKAAYFRALSQYMAANKMTMEYLAAGTKEAHKKLGEAREYAMNEALRATFREASNVARLLTQAEKSHPVANVIIGGLAPFKKTPINIMKRGLEYSPAGLMETIAVESLRLKSGKISGAEYIERFSRGTTGLGVFVIGVFAGLAGFIKAGGGDNDKEEDYDQMLGRQPYSIMVDGRSYTIDWLVPIAMPFLAGVEFATAMTETGDDPTWRDILQNFDFDRFISAAMSSIDPVTELSMLQGINRALDNYEDNKIKAGMLAALESYAGQFIPTIAGQISRVTDDTRRTNYAPEDTEFVGGKAGEQLKNRMVQKMDIFNRADKEPYIDMWGRTEERPDNIFLRAWEQMGAPYYTKEIQKTAVDDELARVFAVSENNAVLPSTPESKLTVEGVDYHLDPKDYTELKRKTGTEAYGTLSEVFKTREYRAMDQAQKELVIKDIYTYARSNALADYAEKKKIPYVPEASVWEVDEAKKAGIDIGLYFISTRTINEFSSDKDANGMSVTKEKDGLMPKKAKVIDYIDSLNLTREQKDAIMKLNGYKGYGE